MALESSLTSMHGLTGFRGSQRYPSWIVKPIIRSHKSHVDRRWFAFHAEYSIGPDSAIISWNNKILFTTSEKCHELHRWTGMLFTFPQCEPVIVFLLLRNWISWTIYFCMALQGFTHYLKIVGFFPESILKQCQNYGMMLENVDDTWINRIQCWICGTFFEHTVPRSSLNNQMYTGKALFRPEKTPECQRHRCDCICHSRSALLSSNCITSIDNWSAKD